MSQAVEHVFAVIGCVTVAIGAVLGLCVALGAVKLTGTFKNDDDDD